MDRKMHETNTDITAKRRLTNIELLRIIAIIMIIAHHFALHSGFDFLGEGDITINRIWVKFLQSGGKIGVDIFVLITGFFLVKSNGVKTNKVIRMWLQMFTWSVLIYAVFVLIGAETFNIREFIKNCLPVIYNKWWFASCYFMLYLLSPYINRLLNLINKREYISLLVLLGVFWCVLPTVFVQPLESNNLLWCIYLYSVGGFIRLYDVKTGRKGTQLICYSLLVWIAVFSVSFMLPYTAGKVASLKCFNNLFELQSLPTAAISILLFLGFKSLDIKENKTINTLASATFGIYLIHDNNYVRPFLWKTVFKNAAIAANSNMILYSVLETAAVYIVCAVLELIRMQLIEKTYIRKIDSISLKIDAKIDSAMNKLTGLF